MKLSDAWTSFDHVTVGQKLGYPLCCTEFYRKVVIEQNISDPTWKIAHPLEAGTEPSEIEVNCSPLSNILWRWMDLTASLFAMPI